MHRRPSRPSAVLRAAALSLAVAGPVALSLAGCAESYQHGYVAPDNALEQVQVGQSREQVLLVLGSPSTTATVGGEAFYVPSRDYIQIPRPEAFPDPINWHRTAFHELGHNAATRIMPHGVVGS